MLVFHIAVALNLIALAVSVGLIVWSMRAKGVGVMFAKIFGYIIGILAIISLLCSFYYGMKIWRVTHHAEQMMRSMPLQRPMQQQ
jgi:hypothetical protein